MNITVIGGGTGTYTVLRGLKKYPVDISAVVSMMDSGGSNRILRDEFGILPTSDIRQCMIALADEHKNKILRDLFTYRFSHGTGIAGMTFGNLFMAALSDMYGSQKEAIQKTCELLHIKGEIAPVTYDNTHLVARYQNGKQILGEHFIDEPNEHNGRLIELSTIPTAKISKEAKRVILASDIVVLGPGDLFTSTIANLVVDGLSEAICASKAKIFYIVNLMTKYGQTDGFTTSDHVGQIRKYLGKWPDCVFVQKPFSMSTEIENRYNEENAYVVKNNLKSTSGIKIIESDFISKTVFEKQKSDKLVRSLVRHDSDKLAGAIIEAWKTAFSVKS